MCRSNIYTKGTSQRLPVEVLDHYEVHSKPKKLELNPTLQSGQLWLTHFLNSQFCPFNPKKTGGGGGLKGPPSTFRAITLQRAKLSPRHFMTFFFQVSRTFWHQICDARGYGSEVTFTTFCTCTSDRKWLQNVILCTKSMQIGVVHIVHIICLFLLSMAEMNLFLIALLCFKKCLPQISPKKTTKTKGKKKKNT